MEAQKGTVELVYDTIKRTYVDAVVGYIDYSGAAIGPEDMAAVEKAVKEATEAETIGMSCVSLEVGEGYYDTVHAHFPKKLPREILVPGEAVDNYLDPVGVELYSRELSDEIKSYPGGEKLLGQPQEHKDVEDERHSSAAFVVCKPGNHGWEYFMCVRTNVLATLPVPERVKEMMESLGIPHSKILPENERVRIDEGVREILERRLDGS